MGSVLGRVGVETPKFSVIANTADYEVREYEPAIVAQFTYNPNEMKGGRDGGFRVLADYIGALGNPQNKSVVDSKEAAEKIAMTAPVITHRGDPEKIAMTAPVITMDSHREGEGGKSMSDSVTMQFVLPAKYSMETVPRPVDERVVVKEMPKRKYGVVRFSGVANEAAVNDITAKLRKCLEDAGYEVCGGVLLARYNPPWTLPFFRTNEVMLPVR